jgi:hypothetical protein
LSLEIDLGAGRVPVADAWKVEVVGTPTAAVVATAVGGHVSRLDVVVNGGTLLLDGNHLRPKILIESLRFEEGKGITEASYRGRGIWRPIVCLSTHRLLRPRRMKLVTEHGPARRSGAVALRSTYHRTP